MNTDGETLEEVHARAIHNINAYRGRLHSCECDACGLLRNLNLQEPATDECRTEHRGDWSRWRPTLGGG